MSSVVRAEVSLRVRTVDDGATQAAYVADRSACLDGFDAHATKRLGALDDPDIGLLFSPRRERPDPDALRGAPSDRVG